MSFLDMGMFAENYEPNTEVRVAKQISQNLSDNYGIDYPWEWVWAQNHHETGGFDRLDNELVQNHNYAGIKATNPDTQKIIEGYSPENDGTSYRAFDSDDDFVDYQARNLLNFMPYGLFDARDPAEAAQSLYDGGYYTTSEDYPTPEEAVNNYSNSISQLSKEAPGGRYTVDWDLLKKLYGVG